MKITLIHVENASKVSDQYMYATKVSKSLLDFQEISNSVMMLRISLLINEIIVPWNRN